MGNYHVEQVWPLHYFVGDNTNKAKMIQAFRKAKKITIRGLGELCKLDYSTPSRTERGQYASRITTLKNIADKLGVDIKDIV